MTIETESPAWAVKLYSRAKLPVRCGAAQLAVVSGSLSCTSSVAAVTRHGCTTNSTGTRAGLSFAFSAKTTTVSRYTPATRPRGSYARPSFAGAMPLARLTVSHGSAPAVRAVHDIVPGPVLAMASVSAGWAVLPTAAESANPLGVTASAATGGGVLVSLSTWQVARRNRGSARATAPAARWPRARFPFPLTFPIGPKLSPEWRRDDRCSKAHTGCFGGWGPGTTGGGVAILRQQRGATERRGLTSGAVEHARLWTPDCG